MRLFDRFKGKKGGETPEDDLEFGEEEFAEPSDEGMEEPDLIDLEEEKEEISEELDFMTPSSEEDFASGVGVSELESVAPPRRRLPALPAIPIGKILPIALIVVLPLVVGYFGRPFAEPLVNRTYYATLSMVKGEKVLPATVVLKKLEAERKNLRLDVDKYATVATIDEVTLLQAELRGRLELYNPVLAVMEKIRDWDVRERKYGDLVARHTDLSERLYQRRVNLFNIEKGMRQNEDRLNFLREDRERLLAKRDRSLSQSDHIKNRLGQAETERVVEEARAAEELKDLLSKLGIEALENSSGEPSPPEAVGGTF